MVFICVPALPTWTSYFCSIAGNFRRIAYTHVCTSIKFCTQRHKCTQAGSVRCCFLVGVTTFATLGSFEFSIQLDYILSEFISCQPAALFDGTRKEFQQTLNAASVSLRPRFSRVQLLQDLAHPAQLELSALWNSFHASVFKFGSQPDARDTNTFD